MEYKEQILKLLVEKYRKSKKDAGTNQINRKTRVKPNAVYSKYYDNDGDLERILAVNEAVRACRDMGFVTCIEDPFSYEIREVILVDGRVEEAEQYLKEQCGYESKGDRIRYVESLISEYKDASPAAAAECERLRAKLQQNKLRKDYSDEADLLRALAFVENNHRTLMLREASMMIYGDSKYLEDNVLPGLCRLLRDYRKQPCMENELQDEILKEYGILPEVQKLCFKGPCTLTMSDGSSVPVGMLSGGVELRTEDLEQIRRITVQAEKVITIENKTAYYRYPAENEFVFYLGGYATRFQRDFLKQIQKDNGNLAWYHFGDIDAGGFYIHEHLCRVTGIPFRTFLMGIGQLEDPRWQDCLRKLSREDVRRLKVLQKKEEYRDVVSYMLEHQVKLEQEIVCYFLAEA